MLEIGNPLSKLTAVGPYIFSGFSHGARRTIAKLASPLIDRGLELKGKNGFLSFDHKIWQDISEKISSIDANDIPDMLRSPDRVSLAVIVTANRTAESFMEMLDDWKISHSNAAIKLHSGMQFVLFEGCDADITLAVEESGYIPNIHRASNEKLANSEKTPCPVERRGRVTPNQAEVKASGVRREHVPAAKAKICSELHGNMQRAAEMTAPLYVFISQEYI